MTQRVVVIGAGGFGREVLDVIAAVNAASSTEELELIGVVDDSPSARNVELLGERGATLLGGIDHFLRSGTDAFFVVGIGSPQVRASIADRFSRSGFEALPPLVHPTATLGFGVLLGAGTVVCAGARLTTNIRVGRHVHLNPNVTIGHDSTIGHHVSLNPGATVSGDCAIEDGVLLGAGSVVLNQLTVGAGATVGGSACVVRDVSPGVTVVGVPARDRRSG